MRVRSIALALSLVACLATGALAAPLTVSEPTVDFGSMKEGPVASRTVTLTNTSGQAVAVGNVTTS